MLNGKAQRAPIVKQASTRCERIGAYRIIQGGEKSFSRNLMEVFSMSVEVCKKGGRDRV